LIYRIWKYKKFKFKFLLFTTFLNLKQSN